MKKITILIICCLWFTGSFAQKSLSIHKSDLSAESFLTASIDSVMFSEDETRLYIYTDERVINISLSEVDSITLSHNENIEWGDPSQTNIYLWREDNMPATTSRQAVANSNNPDGPDFRPNMVRFPVAEGMPIKGAVLLCAGGAFAFRGNSGDSFPVARELNALGYQCFVVNYRLRPYTQQEGAQDLARAVRFVRHHADYYGIDPDKIVVAGFSAGGILCGEQVLYWRGTVNASSLDSNYIPDALDSVSADVKGIGHIYSFYGRLSVASTDVELFRQSNLPPTFFCYGTNDGFAGQFAACVNALRQAGVEVEDLVLQGWPHGYGARGNWIPTFDTWMINLFNN